MRDVWVAADNILSPLGESTHENFEQLKKGVSGISAINDPVLSKSDIAAGRILSVCQTPDITRFEQMCLQTIRAVKSRYELPKDRTILIFSTTKGNISFLDQERSEHPRMLLNATGAFIAERSGFQDHIVVSNACISGVMALIVAKRFLQSRRYDHALVVGADELSHFVVSGFESLQALSNERCKPFDADRRGINLGEAAAAMLITTNPKALGANPHIRILGAGLSNDANHISGPSRTGIELSTAIKQALDETDTGPDDIDFISAHGTATLYNDEMESKAFALAGLKAVPLNSLKAYYGHTLGAAGVLETVISTQSLLTNTLIPSLGFERHGVSEPLNIIREVQSRPLKTFLKTASGFGGCNAAIVLQKVN